MKIPFVSWWVWVYLSMSAATIGCHEKPLPPVAEVANNDEAAPKVSIAFAIDVSKSSKEYQVPPFDAKKELTPFIDACIANGGGQISLTNISRYSDIAVATFTIPPGMMPSMPMAPEVGKYVSHQEYYLARKVYDNGLLPNYHRQQAEFEGYCTNERNRFWKEVERVLSTNIDSSYSDTHSALNRLTIAHASRPAGITDCFTVVYGDGITDMPWQVPLTVDSALSQTFYLVHGTANTTLLERQYWVAVCNPICVTNLSVIYQSIYKPFQP